MLRSRLLTLALLLLSTIATAQIGRMETTTIEYEDERVDALTISMKPERKDIQKAFDDWMDDRYDINMKGGGLFSDKNIRTAEAVRIPAVSPDNITLITKTEEDNGETRMTLFASRGLGNYISESDYAAFGGLEDIFDGFLSSYLPEYYEERVAEAEEELEDLREEYNDAEEDIRKNEEEIRELRKENEELSDKMNDLEQSIREAERMLDKRRETRRAVNRRVNGNGLR